MDYMEEKFALKNQAMKSSDYYMEQVMESLDSAQYFSKSSPKCVQSFGLQGGEHRASPCTEHSGEDTSATSAHRPTHTSHTHLQKTLDK